jgi:hypothetical protein
MTPDIKFTLHVSSSNPSQVWPVDGSADADLLQWIEEGYYDIDDDGCATFQLDDMDDLVTLVKFYAPRTVTMRLAVNVDAQEFEAYASLNPMYQGDILGGYRAKEGEELSPATAAKKLDAMSRALAKWAEKNPLDGIELPD